MIRRYPRAAGSCRESRSPRLRVGRFAPSGVALFCDNGAQRVICLATGLDLLFSSAEQLRPDLTGRVPALQDRVAKPVVKRSVSAIDHRAPDLEAICETAKFERVVFGVVNAHGWNALTQSKHGAVIAAGDYEPAFRDPGNKGADSRGDRGADSSVLESLDDPRSYACVGL